MNIASYLLANTYSSLSPLASAFSSICTVNGQEVPCSSLPPFFGSFMPTLIGSMFVIWIIYILVWVALTVLTIVAMWKLFAKAGQPGWAVIVPIYNIVVMLKIVGKPLWWIILMFIPIANIIVGLILTHNIAKVFGKDIGFTLGLIFLPFIFYPILAFGKAVYISPQPVATMPDAVQ